MASKPTFQNLNSYSVSVPRFNNNPVDIPTGKYVTGTYFEEYNTLEGIASDLKIYEVLNLTDKSADPDPDPADIIYDYDATTTVSVTNVNAENVTAENIESINISLTQIPDIICTVTPTTTEFNEDPWGYLVTAVLADGTETAGTPTVIADGPYIMGVGDYNDVAWTLPTATISAIKVYLAASEAGAATGLLATLSPYALSYRHDGDIADGNPVPTVNTTGSINAKHFLLDGALEGTADGLATLDATGKLDVNQLPLLAISNTFVVPTQADRLLLTAQIGDIAIQTDIALTYILFAEPASTNENWKQIALTSLNGSGTTNEIPYWVNSTTLGSSGVTVSAGALKALNIFYDNYNLAVGSSALNRSLTGRYNIAFGNNTLTAVSSGRSNVAIGDSAIANLTSTSDNIGIGDSALYNALTASKNVAIGTSTLGATTAGTYNTALGYSALEVSTGNNNVGIGAYAGSSAYDLTTGSNNTLIGVYASLASATQVTNSTAIGYGARVLTSNTVVLGDDSVTDVLANQFGNAALQARYLKLTSDGAIVFSDVTTYPNTGDVGLARSSAGVVKVTNGSTGYGTIETNIPSGRLVVAGANGRLTSDAGLTYSGTGNTFSLLASASAAAAPAYSYAAQPTYGMFLDTGEQTYAAASHAWKIGGVYYMLLNSTVGFQLPVGLHFGWGTLGGAVDTGLSRIAPGVVGVGAGAAGSVAGVISVAALKARGESVATEWIDAGIPGTARFLVGSRANGSEIRAALAASGDFGVDSTGRFGFTASSGSGYSGALDTIISRRAAATLQLGAADSDLNASIVGQTLAVQSALTGGTADQAGSDFTIQGSLGKGSAASGKILFKVGTPNATGAVQHTANTVLTLEDAGTLGTPAGCVTITGSLATTNEILASSVSVRVDTANVNWFAGGTVGNGLAIIGRNASRVGFFGMHNSMLGLSSQGMVGWTSSTIDGKDTAPDTGLSRSSAGVLKVTDGSTGIGALLSSVKVTPNTGTVAPAVTDSRTVYTNEGSSGITTVTLPTAVAGLQYVGMVQANQTLTITAATGDTIRVSTSVTATGGSVTSDVIGSIIRLTAINATEWFGEITGTWTF